MTDERVFERTIEKRSAVRSGGPGTLKMPINSCVPSRADPNAVEWAAVQMQCSKGDLMNGWKSGRALAYTLQPTTESTH